MKLTLPPERLHAEATARIRKALDHVQNAQNELDWACAELSSLCGAIPVWRASSKLADRVHSFWYRLDGFRARGRYRLDDTNIAALTKRAEQALIEHANRHMDGKAS